MWWVVLSTARAADFPSDTSGCVWDGVPPDTDGDGVLDDVDEHPPEEDGDTDDDGCPDLNDPDDDGDGLPTADEDLNGDGNWQNDTERIVVDDHPPAYLDPWDPLDDDIDGFLDAAWGGDDCADGYAGIYPGAPERWYDGRDGDCSGGSDFDQDRDGFDAEASNVLGPDCDDLDPQVNPAAEEDDGPVDRDCDGYADPHRSLVATGGCSCAHRATPLGPLAPGLFAVVALRRARRS